MSKKCTCHSCNPYAWYMVLCEQCGNKRCPKATDHRHLCTNSNEPGQKGSLYGDYIPPSGRIQTKQHLRYLGEIPVRVEDAMRIAINAHQGQYRRDGVTPYIVHPAAVAARGFNDIQRAAGWLHDVPEECGITFQALREANINEEVVETVMRLTRRPKEEYQQHIWSMRDHENARLTKINDIMVNLSDDPKPSIIKRYERALIILNV